MTLIGSRPLQHSDERNPFHPGGCRARAALAERIGGEAVAVCGGAGVHHACSAGASGRAARKTQPEAVVYIRDIAASYLNPYEVGGEHKLIGTGKTWLNPKDKAL